MAVVLRGNISGGFVSAVEIPTSMVLFPNTGLNHRLLLLYHSFLMKLEMVYDLRQQKVIYLLTVLSPMP